MNMTTACYCSQNNEQATKNTALDTLPSMVCMLITSHIIILYFQSPTWRLIKFSWVFFMLNLQEKCLTTSRFLKVPLEMLNTPSKTLTNVTTRPVLASWPGIDDVQEDVRRSRRVLEGGWCLARGPFVSLDASRLSRMHLVIFSRVLNRWEIVCLFKITLFLLVSVSPRLNCTQISALLCLVLSAWCIQICIKHLLKWYT